ANRWTTWPGYTESLTHIPDALTAVEVNKIRTAIALWEVGVGHVSGPGPTGSSARSKR
ncbi:MAG: hypothetical protein H7201_10775, partial [Candidatus Saccharibacteria bacterium]|nr:hypothetical protein [Microbacteriaceae bacterium]